MFWRRKPRAKSEEAGGTRPRFRLVRLLGRVLFLLLCSFIAYLVLDTIWLRKVRVRACIKCGARDVAEWKQFAGIRYWGWQEVRHGPLAGLHLRLLGPCEHEWASDTGGQSGFGEHWCSDGFPYFDYPITDPTHWPYQGVVLFPNDDLRRQALRALSDRTNRLRFLAESAITQLGWLNHKQRATLDWDAWWATHKDAFVITTDAAEAKAIEQRMRKADKDLVIRGR